MSFVTLQANKIIRVIGNNRYVNVVFDHVDNWHSLSTVVPSVYVS